MLKLTDPLALGRTVTGIEGTYLGHSTVFMLVLPEEPPWALDFFPFSSSKMYNRCMDPGLVPRKSSEGMGQRDLCTRQIV